MTLTHAAISAAHPRNKPYKLADRQGLYLLVASSGTKSWRYKYDFGGKERLLTLGRFPDMGLADARALHEDARRLIRAGKDPVVEAKREKQTRISATEATFKKMAEIWLEEQSPLWSPANAKRIKNRLENDIYPCFGSVPIASVDGSMVLHALRKIENRGSIETAKRVRGYIRSIINRAKGEKLVGREAIHEIDDIREALKPTPRGRRMPALTSLSTLLDLQLTVDRSTGGLFVKLASRLLALTQVRIGVLRAATWDEFDGIDWAHPDAPCERPVWRISSERMKLEVEDKGNEAFGHDVPLSTQAVDTLRALRIITGKCRYLFPHAKSWREPMTDSALSSLYKRMGGGRFKGRMVPHGWRTAFSTLMNERAAELERDGDRMIIDMILAHVPEGMSASEWAYNRARYFKPRAALLQVWADMISRSLPAPLMLVVRDDGS
ncbi:integrase [Altererythrobacter sp. B11]|uniref:tyrosine-type recombinase/integrase n=1 Tax=Altererythrobacter sp. B11 TaxID=2060312 RepID=UPI000DC6FD9C|nr:integrase arm-type DNA-binding domain-containing protein [Altererythrobacter sp. B11]BBC73311.1 integrase [Altererythrobacter sp. B11]